MSKQRIVAVIAPALGGKSTFCQYLNGFQVNSFAEPLYQMAGVIMGPNEMMRARTSNSKHDPLDAFCGKSLREALQTLGTEWGRNSVGEDIWVNHLLTRTRGCPAICIDDLRFPNEYDALTQRDAVFVRLLPDKTARAESGKSKAKSGSKSDLMKHESESHWMTFKVHAELEWDERQEIIDFATGFDPEEFMGKEATL